MLLAPCSNALSVAGTFERRSHPLRGCAGMRLHIPHQQLIDHLPGTGKLACDRLDALFFPGHH
jgi:hypothetical protein